MSVRRLILSVGIDIGAHDFDSRPVCVELFCPALKSHIQQFVKPTHSTQVDKGLFVFTGEDELSLSFNISFMMNARPSFIMQEATSTVVGAHPTSGDLTTGKQAVRTAGIGTRWLFPQPDDVERIPVTLGQDILEHEWIDPGLNQEQRVGPSLTFCCII